MKAPEIGGFTADGWQRVEDHEPNIHRYIHACYHCGHPEAQMWRASPSTGTPWYGPTSHTDPFDCIRYLREKLAEVTQ